MHSLISVGIDIGTTSLHLTLSKLKFANQSAFNQVPRLAICEREILYQSPIYFTPLSDDGSIEPEAVAKLVRDEYARAGIKAQEVMAGAVIITGETAKKRRAEEVVHAIADIAGDFVVASAGPHLESILAARGAGAVAASKEQGKTICNVDIGGGTANAAVYKDGLLLDNACLALGGRFMRIGADGSVAAITEAATELLRLSKEQIVPGDRLSHERLLQLADLVAAAIVEFISGSALSDKVERCLLTEQLQKDYLIDEYWLSGGVAELMGQAQERKNWLPYGDMGAYLANGLEKHLAVNQLPYSIAGNAIRATVIGAGLHTLQLTGSTIAASEQGLPLRNLPLIRPFESSDRKSAGESSQALDEWVKMRLSQYLHKHDIDWNSRALAVVLEDFPTLSHEHLTKWAHALAKAFDALKGKEPLIVVVRQDIAMALGMLLRKLLAQTELLVLDGLQIEDGDYIDIGKPLTERGTSTVALPVVIKSLLFYT